MTGSSGQKSIAVQTESALSACRDLSYDESTEIGPIGYVVTCVCFKYIMCIYIFMIYACIVCVCIVYVLSYQIAANHRLVLRLSSHLKI